MNPWSPPETETRDLIAQYVLECRGRGVMLPYDDYRIIDRWVELFDSPDHLLLILDEHLPSYFEKAQERSITPNLRGIDKTVTKKLHYARLREPQKPSS